MHLWIVGMELPKIDSMRMCQTVLRPSLDNWVKVYAFEAWILRKSDQLKDVIQSQKGLKLLIRSSRAIIPHVIQFSKPRGSVTAMPFVLCVEWISVWRTAVSTITVTLQRTHSGGQSMLLQLN